ncbi:MAG: hypothetical protein OEZ47_16410 [Gammaproteobacteria bacterium]|nr:hypothetical protein [Gammaproteobacteria bacterium]
MNKIISLAIFLSLGLIHQASAIEMPSTEEVKKVMDFYYEGNGMGVVLLEAQVCHGTVQAGPKKHECAGPIGMNPIQEGQEIVFWTSFFVPKDSENENIMISFENGGFPKFLKQMSVKGATRYRNWVKVKPNSDGEWTARIIHEGKDDSTQLGTVIFNVQTLKQQ